MGFLAIILQIVCSNYIQYIIHLNLTIITCCHDLMKRKSSKILISKLVFLMLCDQAFNLPFLGGKIIELAKFCFFK